MNSLRNTATSTVHTIRQNCVRQNSRDNITEKEKLVSILLILSYAPLIYLTIKNLLKFYEKERKKYYHFIPRINLLLFTTVYSKIAVLMDSVTLFFDPKTQLYKDIAVYNFLEIWTFTSLCWSCTYISTIW